MLSSAVVSPGWAEPRFGRPGAFPVDGSPVGIRAGVIDTQASLDLVTANEAGSEGPSLSKLFNRGLGSFFPEERMSLSATTYILQALAAGDFNADGQDDLALAVDNVSELPIQGQILVLRNTGQGDFAAPAELGLGGGLLPRCIEAADVTGDGALDLVVCHARNFNDMAQGRITLFTAQTQDGFPTGRFSRSFSETVGSAPSGLTIGDLDRDGRMDVVVADPDADAVYVLYGTAGTMPFGSPVLLANVADPHTPLINALPGAGLPRVLVATSRGRLFTFAQVSARTFAQPTQATIGFLSDAVAQGRIDGDAIDDLVVVSGLGAELWAGQANGGFTFAESIAADALLGCGSATYPPVCRVELAHLNGDGALDVAISSANRDEVIVALNGQDVPSTPGPTATITPTPTGVATATSDPSGSPTATRTPGGCAGDCNGSGDVVVNELIIGVNIALGNTTSSSCQAFDRDDNGQVTVNELIAAVNAALSGCPAAG
jgi:hypothetical protein